MSSPSASAGPAAPSKGNARRFSKRDKIRNLRNATFIIPSTNERAKRQFTLTNRANFDGPSRSRSNSSDDQLIPFEHRFSSAGTFHTALHNSRISAARLWRWLNSRTGRGVLKCSFAYLLGSMGTFVPFLSQFLGKQDGKHMVATIVVYFHPARSAGSMVEAVILGVLAFLYAMFISISSMAISVLCETQFGHIELGYAIVLIVFCGGGLGFVGWIKQKFSMPLVNVACSLTSLAIITVLTKENAIQTAVFSNDKITQVMKMLILAMTITTAVNLLVWPVSARQDLRQTMINTTNAFDEMLTTITRSFLSGSETELRSSAFQDGAKRYKGIFSELTKNLNEAKAEHYILGTEDEYNHEARLVNCMQRLSQAIGGLRSAAMTQFTLLRETTSYGSSTPINSIRYSIPLVRGNYFSLLPKDKQEQFDVLTAINETSEENSDIEDLPQDDETLTIPESPDMSSFPTMKSPSEIFSRFIVHLGPSMKSLAYTLSQILQELPFGKGPEFKITVNEHFNTSLKDALELYSGARAEALKELYRSKELWKDRPENIEADFEEVAASCGHFSFSLQDFAGEMQTFLEILDDMKLNTESPHRRTWKWMKFWQRQRDLVSLNRNGIDDPEREGLINHSQENDLLKDLPGTLLSRRNTVIATVEQSSTQSIYSLILKVVRFLERDDIRFAIKVGAGAAAWAMFAFIPQTRPFYGLWRGEWGLLSYMLVCSMTLGASNTTGYSRFIGTIIGATIAAIVWLTCQGNRYALALCGWGVGLWCFYIIVAVGNAPFGRFILLTYNLSCLYAYSLSVRESDDDDDEGGINPNITDIALHRVVSVISGVLWGLIITRIIWPISARQKFKDGLSVLWLRMGLIWKRDPLTTILNGEPSVACINQREEFALQRYVARLENLRNSATSEFELRGPFPEVQFGRIMDATNKMLDAFHAMNVIIQKDHRASPGEAAILKFTSNERAQLCTRISHLFQVLASSMKLEYPLNDALPSTSNSRDRLLAKIFQFRKNEASLESGPIAKDEDYALCYAFALVERQLAEEITRVEREIDGLYGTIDQELLELY